MPWFYYVARAIVWILFNLLTHRQVIGRENVPSQGPLLVVANHLNLSDPPLLGISLGRKVIFMAKEGLFRSKLSSYFMRGFGAFPVNREQLTKQALRQAQQVLAEGLALVIFPEGARSHNTQLQPALSGSALIACRQRVPILPVGITGTERIKGVAWLVHRPQITVSIGRPFYLPPVNGKLTKDELAQLTDDIMEHIAELLPQEYQGNYRREEAARHEN